MKQLWKEIWAALTAPPFELQVLEWRMKCAEEDARLSSIRFDQNMRSIRSQAIRKAFDRKPIREDR